MGKARALTTSTPLNETHISEKKAHIARSSLDYSPVCSPIPPCAWPARKRGVHRHGVEAGHHDVFDLRRIWRVVALSRKARADVAAALVARTDAMALIALDVEVAHYMDRLKPAQNGLIFTFESTLRIDAHESISAMTPIRKNSARKRRAVVRAVAGEEGESRSPRIALLY